MPVAPTVEAFIARWQSAGGSERANCQLFLGELCALLDKEVYRYRVDYWQWFDNSNAKPALKNEGGNT